MAATVQRHVPCECPLPEASRHTHDRPLRAGETMWIVRLALRRTYTFVVVALLIAVLGAVSIYRMSTDIFPSIDIPVVSVVWQFFVMPADEIETRITVITQRVLTASVNYLEPS